MLPQAEKRDRDAVLFAIGLYKTNSVIPEIARSESVYPGCTEKAFREAENKKKDTG